jgi:hypothetical protein
MKGGMPMPAAAQADAKADAEEPNQGAKRQSYSEQLPRVN